MHVPGAENYAAEGFWNHNTGKTKAGANWVLDLALAEDGVFIAVCAPTYAAVREVCFEGQSGILREAQPGDIVYYNKNNLKMETRNGSIIQGFSAENVDSIRGMNLTYAWLDELASFPDPAFYTFGLRPALRVKRADGGPPRMMVTTTPKAVKLIRDLMKNITRDPERFHLTRAMSIENPYLSVQAVDEMYEALRHSNMGSRQELEGELVLETDGAFFRIADFDKYRIEPGTEPEFRRVVIGVDPATTSGNRSDETGIVVIAEGIDKSSYCLEDASIRGTPDDVMSQIELMWDRYEADLVVVEKNAAGDYFTTLLAQKNAYIPTRNVTAMKGKKIRAEPIAHLNEIGRIHMVGNDFEKLEEQLTVMNAEQDRAKMGDDRADAFVWAMIELAGKGKTNWEQVYGFSECKHCGEDVNHMVDKKCKSCGQAVVPDKLQKVTGMEKHAQRWWKAYTKECPNGHDNYSMSLRKCPECDVNPGAYLAQALALSGQGGSKYSYTGKDYFRGRKF